MWFPETSKSAVVCPSPLRSHCVVIKPSIPTGPRAWRRPVLIPTSAPSPNRNPSENRVLALWNTQALSTSERNWSAVAAVTRDQEGRKNCMQLAKKCVHEVYTCTIFSDDAVCVSTAVSVDVLYGFPNRGHDLHCALQAAILLAQCCHGRWERERGS